MASNSSRRISVHQALGGGYVADVLLWRKWCGGVVILTSATALWYLFERAGYNFFVFLSPMFYCFSSSFFFFWGKSASLLNRPLPPLPDLEISEEYVSMVVEELRFWINCALSIARDIAIGRNLRLFLQVALALWIASFVGSFFNFLTLIYIGVILSLSVPLVYDNYQDQIDEKLCEAYRYVQMQYKKLDENVLRKIPLPLNKEKKMQ